MKPLGSITFNTSNMRTDEVVMFAQVMKDNNHKTEEILPTISFIDDLLSIQRMQIIGVDHSRTAKGRLRKKSTYMDMIEWRLELLIEKRKM